MGRHPRQLIILWASDNAQPPRLAKISRSEHGAGPLSLEEAVEIVQT
jgi:hypothetical protein